MMCMESTRVSVGSVAPQTISCQRDDLHVWHRGVVNGDDRSVILATIEWQTAYRVADAGRVCTWCDGSGRI